jgi:4'-phosphopantetheinyl transferase EntD
MLVIPSGVEGPGGWGGATSHPPPRSLDYARDDKEEWFTHEELSIASSFKLPKRRDEWLLSRYAAKQLALRLGIATDPRDVRVERPRLVIGGVPSEWYVSLSHSASYAAAAIDRSPIGVDIQVVRELSDAATHLFLSDAETAEMHRCTLPNAILHFWCAKEAAWKQHSTELATLKQVAIHLERASDSGLLFDAVETTTRGDLIIALTNGVRPSLR